MLRESVGAYLSFDGGLEQGTNLQSHRCAVRNEPLILKQDFTVYKLFLLPQLLSLRFMPHLSAFLSTRLALIPSLAAFVTIFSLISESQEIANCARDGQRFIIAIY